MGGGEYEVQGEGGGVGGHYFLFAKSFKIFLGMGVGGIR